MSFLDSIISGNSSNVSHSTATPMLADISSLLNPVEHSPSDDIGQVPMPSVTSILPISLETHLHTQIPASTTMALLPTKTENAAPTPTMHGPSLPKMAPNFSFPKPDQTKVQAQNQPPGSPNLSSPAAITCISALGLVAIILLFIFVRNLTKIHDPYCDAESPNYKPRQTDFYPRFIRDSLTAICNMPHNIVYSNHNKNESIRESTISDMLDNNDPIRESTISDMLDDEDPIRETTDKSSIDSCDDSLFYKSVIFQ